VHLYLDGLYWGLYWLHGGMDAAAAASYLGGEKEEWEVLKHTGDTAGLQSGTLTNYQAMFILARSGLANNSVYVLKEAWCRSAIEINSREGQFRVRFEGTTCEELL
jgi:hypothetical protein